MTDDREQPDLDQRWEELARFLAGESSAEEERVIRARLEDDADRAALVNALDAALTRPDEPPLSPREVESALASVMARRDLPVDRAVERTADVIPLATRRRPGSPTTWWRGVAVLAAAIVALVAGVSVVLHNGRGNPTEPAGQAIAAAIVHQTRAGQIDTVRLADGSTVVLGPESRLALGEGFGRQSRELRLEGQAFFEVVHDDARPFLVRTTTATLRAGRRCQRC